MKFTYGRMPKIQPVSIDTKKYRWFIRFYKWATFTRKFELVYNWYFKLDDEQYVVKKGFVYNGASVPRLARNIFSPTGPFFVASLPHDCGYEYHGLMTYPEYEIKEFSRGYIDEVFKQAVIASTGMTNLAAFGHKVLKTCGHKAWDKDNK